MAERPGPPLSAWCQIMGITRDAAWHYVRNGTLPTLQERPRGRHYVDLDALQERDPALVAAFWAAHDRAHLPPSDVDERERGLPVEMTLPELARRTSIEVHVLRYRSKRGRTSRSPRLPTRRRGGQDVVLVGELAELARQAQRGLAHGWYAELWRLLLAGGADEDAVASLEDELGET